MSSCVDVKTLQHLMSRPRNQWSSLKDRVRSKKIVSLKFGKKLLDKENRLGETALHIAAQSGDLNTLQQLISLGANVNKPTGSNQGNTPPLVYAASNGHLSCVKILLVAGANVNGSDEWSNTALLKAACYHHTECVKVLLDFGARVNIGNKWGALPLQYAAIQGYNDIVELLIKNGAKYSTEKTDVSLPPPVLGAATRCHSSTLALLLQKCEVESREVDSALIMALYYFLCACAGYESLGSSADYESDNGVSTVDLPKSSVHNVSSSIDLSMSSVHNISSKVDLSKSSVQPLIMGRFSCIEVLVRYGAVIKPEHLHMCCYHYFIPLLNLHTYIHMLTFLLQSIPYDKTSQQWNNALAVLFGHATCLGPHKWELIKLICSVGFTPSQDLLDSLKFTLTDSEYEELYKLHSQPRSLSDLSRLAVRQAAKHNVIHMNSRLTLPKVIQDVILCNNKYFSTL